MIIRNAEERDLPDILEIYNYEVLHGVATLDLHEKTLDDRKMWFLAHTGSHRIIVAEIDGKSVGYASLSPYREKEAYKSTVELSIYVDVDFRRRGIAKSLMREILGIARNDKSLHSVVSVITSGNEASEKLHKDFGFTFCGTLREVGFKSGSYRDIDNFELIL